MAHHKRPHHHAVRTPGTHASRWAAGEAAHRVDQPNAAQRAQFIIAMGANPTRFRQMVTQWKARNPDGVLELGDVAAYTTISDMNFTPYEPRDLAGVAFSRVTFRNATFSGEDQVAAFDDSDTYYNGVLLDGKSVEKPRPTAQEADRAAARKRNADEVARMNAMLRGR